MERTVTKALLLKFKTLQNFANQKNFLGDLISRIATP